MLIKTKDDRKLAIDIFYDGPWQTLRATQVEISDVTTPEEPIFLGIGCATCATEDNFVKRTGRVIAIARALTDWLEGTALSAEEQRAMRTEVWAKLQEKGLKLH